METMPRILKLSKLSLIRTLYDVIVSFQVIFMGLL